MFRTLGPSQLSVLDKALLCAVGLRYCSASSGAIGLVVSPCAAQASQSPDPTQTAPSAPPSPLPPSKARKVPPGAIGLLAGGGALALAGVGLLAGAWATGNQARADGTTYADWVALNDKGSALNTGGLVLSVVGGALAIGGAVLAIVPSRRQEQPAIAE